MEEEEVIRRLDNALRRVAENDRHLLEFDLSERCIASRLALYLQNEFPEFNVDVEYNRDGATPSWYRLPYKSAIHKPIERLWNLIALEKPLILQILDNDSDNWR